MNNRANTATVVPGFFSALCHLCYICLIVLSLSPMQVKELTLNLITFIYPLSKLLL